jgi:plasmid stabilization system protein ParE
MRLELSRFVESDLEAIADFIAEESPERAVAFVRRIWRAILRIERVVYGGRDLPRLVPDPKVSPSR